MTESPTEGATPLDDAPIVVAHPRLLVAESLCVALRGKGIDTHLEDHDHASVALVETSLLPLIERLAERGAVVISFGRTDAAEVARASAAGASTHLDEGIGLDELSTRLREAARTGRTRAGTRRRDRRRHPIDDLTPRERQVLQALVSGMRAADIARADYVSVTTVRNQIQSILTKLNAHSQVEAISIAVRAGWTPLAA